MPGIHHLPLSRQPLAFFISALLAGQALAEVAGKVSFVSGQVNAIALDGGERLLTRGAVVNIVGYYLVGLPLGLILAFPLGVGPRGLWLGQSVALAVIAGLLLRRITVLVGRPRPDA